VPEYKAPLRDMQFVLHDVFQAETLWSELGLEDVNRELADAILDEAAKISQNLMSPLNRSGDEQGVSWNDTVVTTPDGFPAAYRELAEGGWGALAGDPEYGGQVIPKMLVLLFEEMSYGANMALGLYLSLTSGAALAIASHASEELKSRYLPDMYAGNWAGSMCLTEAHAGTDLGIIRTKAEPQADGSYSITGNKIFITGGEHDLTENIIHLVLAKLPDAPAGSKGISLFLVPKFHVNDDGSLGERNEVSCGSVEHKMGIHASATCVLNFDGAKGYLVGELNRGLAAMFTMMNYERLSVGVQGLGLSSASYQSALDYAQERLQGRSPAGPENRDGPADSLMVHPDVRRMLLTQKAYVEAGRAFAVFVGQQLDTAKFGSGEAQQRSAGLVELLTPIAKAFLTDKGLEATIIGQQVFGGHGYVREWGMEQLVRDTRIAQIYEGANGIQALDLMGRKIASNGGQNMAVLIQEMRDFAAAAEGELSEFTQPLLDAVTELETLTATVLSAAGDDPHAIGAASVEYLHIAGLTIYAYMWARMAGVALAADQDDAFYAGKLHTARFFMQRLLPQVKSLAESVRAGSAVLMDIPVEAF